MFRMLRSPRQIKVDKEGKGFKVYVPVACSDNGDVITSVICNLNPISIDGESYHEFSFSIAIDRLDGPGGPVLTQDRQVVANYIPNGGQQHVMDMVSLGLYTLINYVAPPQLYGVTRESDTPGKWLDKYHFLIKQAQIHGYVPLGEGTDTLGRRYWTMRVR